MKNDACAIIFKSFGLSYPYFYFLQGFKIGSSACVSGSKRILERARPIFFAISARGGRENFALYLSTTPEVVGYCHHTTHCLLPEKPPSRQCPLPI
jgi:hypothetical protein